MTPLLERGEPGVLHWNSRLHQVKGFKRGKQRGGGGMKRRYRVGEDRGEGRKALKSFWPKRVWGDPRMSGGSNKVLLWGGLEPGFSSG